MRGFIFVSVFIPAFLVGSVLPAGLIDNRQAGEELVYYTLDGLKIYRDGRISYGDTEIRLKGISHLNIRAEGPTSRFSLFTGHGVRRNMQVYQKVVFENVYPNVDFVITPMGKAVEFQWFVHPGGKVEDIAIEVLRGNPGFRHLRAFQGSEEVEIALEESGGLISFRVGQLDPNRVLVIDPIAFISNDINEMAYGMNVDDSGYVYVTGYVASTAGMGDWDIFVSKLSPDLSQLISTALIYGDSGYYDLGFSIDFDSEGNVYIAGWTFDTTSNFGGGNVVYYGEKGIVDAFVLKMNSDLDSILSTAIITSPSVDQAFSVYYRNDTVYVGGVASDADNFSASRTIYGTHSGTYDMSGFVTALSGDLMTHYATAIVASPSPDYGEGIYVGHDRVYLFGYTYDPDGFSSSRVVYGPTGNGDAFVTVFTNDLSHVQTIILASDSLDIARGILEVDSGNIIVAGITANAPNFSTDRIIQGPAGNDDIYLTLLDSSLSPVRTLVVASPSFDRIDYGTERSLGILGNRVAVYAYSDYITALGGSIEKNMCGTGGSSDAVVIWINPSLDSAMAVSVLTGNGTDNASGDAVIKDSILYFAGSVSSAYDAGTYYGPVYSYGTQDESDAFVGYLEEDCIPTAHKESGSASFALKGDMLRLTIPEPAYVGFDIFDAAGRRVFTYSAGFLMPGEYSFPIDLPQGIYLLRLRIGDEVHVHKMVK